MEVMVFGMARQGMEKARHQRQQKKKTTLCSFIHIISLGDNQTRSFSPLPVRRMIPDEETTFTYSYSLRCEI